MKIRFPGEAGARLRRAGVIATYVLVVGLVAFAILRGSWVAGISVVLILVAAVLTRALSR